MLIILQSRSPGYRCLDEGIRVLYFVWVSLVWKKPSVYSPKDDSLNLMFNRTRFRCRRVLEHLFRVQSGEVFESIVDWWSRENLVSLHVELESGVLFMICLAFCQKPRRRV